MNYRKKATLKAIRISKGVGGYYIVKHSWVWKINRYWTQRIETRDLVKFLILRLYLMLLGMGIRIGFLCLKVENIFRQSGI